MSLLFLIFIFVLVAFLTGEPESGSLNPIISYYLIYLRLIQNNLLIFLVFLLGGSFIYYLSKSKQGLKTIIFKLLEKIIFSSIAGLVFLFLIAILQLNITSLLLNMDSGLSGVERDTDVIVEQLKNLSSRPVIIVGDEDGGSLVPAVAASQSGIDSFYASKILKGVPKFLVIPVKKKGSGALMVSDTLILSRVNSTDFQKISPVLSYLFIKHYFSEKEIKRYPEIYLMGKDEYQRYREDDYKKKSEVLGEIVIEINGKYDDLTSQIPDKENELSQKKEDLANAKSENEKVYSECVNEGIYEEGGFVKLNEKEDCREQLRIAEDGLSDLKDEIETLEVEIQKNNDALKNYENYIKYYESQKLLTEQSTGFISFEFAAFEPPDEIRVALTDKTDSQSVADYFVLLVHEYLHYSTFNEEGEGLATSFFTEGLTEYFARKIVKSNLGIDTNIAYPVNVKIIEGFNKRIPDSDLADVYFGNDEEKLQELFDKVYGEGFYERNQILLETLQYSSDVESILEIANDIMDEIGGEHLTKEDTETTHSTFE